jgi:hypothetical protein
LTIIVTIFNDNDSASESSLALTANGPEEYSFHDTQPVNVSAGKFMEYSFTWIVPDAAGTYLVEVELAPAQLTAYDAAWLAVS